MYHINPATGIILHCKNPEYCSIYLDADRHYPSYNSAELALDADRSINFFNAVSELPFEVNDNFNNVFEEAICSGFVKNDSSPCEVQRQLNILRLPEIFDYLVNELITMDNDFERMRYIRVICWIIRDHAKAISADWDICYRELYEPRIASLFDRHIISVNLYNFNVTDDKELVNFACNLWVYKNSPFHEYAKALLLLDDSIVDGYIPNSIKNYTQYDNESIIGALGIDKDDLLDGFIAYDIETDTSYGYGLRPTKTQITELVISDKHTSYVFSGDEKYILECFADYMNNLPHNATLAGWNNFSFDNIVLQTRAEYHKISNWNGFLTSVEGNTVFEPVGPLTSPQKLSWINGNDTINSIDLFQRKVMIDNIRGDFKYSIGLKPFVESLGCYPVTVDRHNLHLLDITDRVTYVLSDGLATLRAVKELL